MRLRHIWNDEEKKYLRDITPGRHYKEIQILMNEKFEYQFNLNQIKGAIARYKLNTGFTGRFEKGHYPVSKGTKGMMKANKTSFKKGQVPANKRHIGSERVDVDGYTLVKVAEPNKWRLKSRVLYEEYHNVKLSNNDIVIFADRNKSNLSKDNLVLVSRKELLNLNKLNLIKSDTDLTKTSVNVVKLMLKIKKLEK